MARPLEIKRIDFIVHPFYDLFARYSPENAEYLLQMWKEHIDEAAKDKNKLLFVLSTVTSSDQTKISDALLRYAKRKMRERFCETEGSDTLGYFVHKGKRFKNFNDFAKANGFAVNKKRVRTRGLGERTNACVAGFLTRLNIQIGLPNPIPYRNPQSTVLPRKSVAGKREYPFPWRLKKLMRTASGKEQVRRQMQKYIKERQAKANRLAAVYLSEKIPFKPRNLKPKRKH